MLPYVPPEVAVRLMHQDSYPELSDRPRPKARPLAASRRRLGPGALEAVVAKLPKLGATGAIALRDARLEPARGQ